jgi:acetyl-CoA acetyltransferase
MKLLLVIFYQPVKVRELQDKPQSVNAGIPKEVPAYSLNMVCGSGMKAISNAFTSIKAGEAKLNYSWWNRIICLVHHS